MRLRTGGGNIEIIEVEVRRIDGDLKNYIQITQKDISEYL
jgi:hypothetical protein